MTREQVVERARSAIGHGCIYALGRGGFSPKNQWPWNSKLECDCSGFTSWAIGFSRKTDHPFYRSVNGGWLETSAMVKDANSTFGMFDLVPWTAALPGHFVVYGDAGGGQGHVGIVSEINLLAGPAKAIHCASGAYRRNGDAIAETEIGGFRAHGAIIARCALVEG
jgi:cell wall-associated NlpC family hydrolase